MTDKLPPQIDEASTVFNDPPVVLVLRRKAIRMFPHGQSVAQYRNDNLNIDVAIPYTPGTLGKTRMHVATSEGVRKAMAAALEEMRDLGKDSRDINTGLGNRYSHLRVKENPKAYKANSSYAAWTIHGKNEGDKKGKAIATLVHKHNTKFEEVQTVDEAMSPELKKIRKERGLFKRDLSRQEDRFETSKQRLDWAKRALAGHIKKHGKSLDALGEEVEQISELSKKLLGRYIKRSAEDAAHDSNIKGYVSGKRNSLYNDSETSRREIKRHRGIETAVKKLTKEETIDELSRQTLGSYVKAASKDAAGHIEKANHYTPKPIKYHREKAKKRLSGIERATGALTKEELEDNTIMEATIHSLHTINKTQSPAKIRFRDGSSAMIDHPTAQQIMHLHGKVNRLNKKKIESLINSGPMGIRKVSTFIKDHMKIGK